MTGRVALSGDIVQIPDNLADPEFTVASSLRMKGIRALLGVPLMRDGEVEGVFVLGKTEPGLFGERAVELARTFADQAVIAVQNVRLFEAVEAKSRDLTEALRFQTATSEVLKAISQSPDSLEPVLDVIVETSRNLCAAQQAAIFMLDGERYRLAAESGLAASFLEFLKSNPIALDQRGSSTSRAAREKRTVHVPDITRDPEYGDGPMGRGDPRALLSVPLMRQGMPVGVITLLQPDVTPFSARQIEAVETFADQAIIAIENSRLFEEVQARTRDLSEALQQQTATAEVLKVISRSAFDLDLATSTILVAAAKLCRAPLATLHLRDGDVCRLATQFGMPEAFERKARAEPIPVRYPLHSRRPARTGVVAHFSDAWTDPDYLYKTTAKMAGYRAIVVIPLMREDELVGIFSLGRPEPEPFTEGQIKLVQSFADQAAIAVENSRLFNEVKARTGDLTEALQQQTATAEVLKVISRSAFDLDAVLNSLTRSAVELCNSTYGAISLYRDGVLKFMAQTGCTPEFAELLWSHPAQLDRKTATGRAGLLRSVVLIPDVTEDEEYDYHGGETIGNYRSMMSVPLLRNGELEGVFTLMRHEPGTFTSRQVELVETFADQAVIAIENARLFEEVQARTRDLTEALQQQTATAEVLKVISRSAFDLQPVFDTMVSSAVELCGGHSGLICIRDGEVFRYRGSAGSGQTRAPR